MTIARSIGDAGWAFGADVGAALDRLEEIDALLFIKQVEPRRDRSPAGG